MAVDAASAGELSERLWESLNEENKVSLYVSFVDLATGQADTVIRNKHSQQ